MSVRPSRFLTVSCPLNIGFTIHAYTRQRCCLTWFMSKLVQCKTINSVTKRQNKQCSVFKRYMESHHLWTYVFFGPSGKYLQIYYYGNAKTFWSPGIIYLSLLCHECFRPTVRQQQHNFTSNRDPTSLLMSKNYIYRCGMATLTWITIHVVIQTLVYEEYCDYFRAIRHRLLHRQQLWKSFNHELK